MGILNGNIPFQQLRFKDDNLPTDSSIEQVKCCTAAYIYSAYVDMSI